MIELYVYSTTLSPGNQGVFSAPENTTDGIPFPGSKSLKKTFSVLMTLQSLDHAISATPT